MVTHIVCHVGLNQTSLGNGSKAWFITFKRSGIEIFEV